MALVRMSNVPNRGPHRSVYTVFYVWEIDCFVLCCCLVSNENNNFVEFRGQRQLSGAKEGVRLGTGLDGGHFTFRFSDWLVAKGAPYNGCDGSIVTGTALFYYRLDIFVSNGHRQLM